MKRSNPSVLVSNKTHKISEDYLNDVDNELENSLSASNDPEIVSLKRVIDNTEVVAVKRARPAPISYFDSDTDDEQYDEVKDAPKSFSSIVQETSASSNNRETSSIHRTRALLDLSKLNEELNKIDTNAVKVVKPIKQFVPVAAETIVRPRSVFGSVEGHSPTSAVSPFVLTIAKPQASFGQYRDRSDSFGSDHSDCEESLTF